MMERKTAAEYLDMTEPAFVREVACGRLPAAVMLEHGASVAEVSSITGQSFAIVEHYAKRINQRTMGDAVMLKWGKK